MKPRRDRTDAYYAAQALDAARAYHEPPWSIVDDQRAAARDARRDERGGYRRVGDEWVDESRVPGRGDE